MTEIMDRLITRHYSARVLGLEPLEQVIKDFKIAVGDPDILEEAKQRLTALNEHMSARGGDLSQHDFCGHIERIGLMEVLDGR